MIRVFGLLASTWGTQMKLLASGFNVALYVAIWGVNQGTEDVFLCPLSHCDSSIHTNQSKGKK